MSTDKQTQLIWMQNLPLVLTLTNPIVIVAQTVTNKMTCDLEQSLNCKPTFESVGDGTWRAVCPMGIAGGCQPLNLSQIDAANKAAGTLNGSRRTAPPLQVDEEDRPITHRWPK